MLNRRLLTQFDYLLFGTALALALFGVLGVYSASPELYLDQLVRVGLGICVCLIVVYIDYHFLLDHVYFIYWVAVLVLIGVLIWGFEIHGSRSWVSVAGFSFQPSEVSKIVLILVLARYLSESGTERPESRQLIISGILTFILVGLVVLQQDLGTAIMYLPVAGAILIVAGLRWKVLLSILLIVLCLAPLGWCGLREYQKQRVLVTLDPELDPQGIGYQTRQSQIAIGSAGFLGHGIGKGLQNQLGFVPESHTDFIFALLAEETGFLGGSMILLLYLLLLIRLTLIGEQARDRAGLLIMVGITGLIFSHVVVNVGMALGIVPPIGIPLPLLSYGGSATITTFISMGLALSVSCRRFFY
jgi:rod shape determining protein RodA